MVPNPSCSTKSQHDVNPESCEKPQAPPGAPVSLGQGQLGKRRAGSSLLWGGTGWARALRVTGHPGSTSGENFCLSQGKGGGGHWCRWPCPVLTQHGTSPENQVPPAPGPQLRNQTSVPCVQEEHKPQPWPHKPSIPSHSMPTTLLDAGPQSKPGHEIQLTRD